MFADDTKIFRIIDEDNKDIPQADLNNLMCYKLTNDIYDNKVSQFLTLHENIAENPNRTRGHCK